MENPIELNKSGCAHAAHVIQPGGCGHQHFEKATEMLSDEHRVIERVLAVVEKLTSKPPWRARSRYLEESTRFLSLLRGPVPSF